VVEHIPFNLSEFQNLFSVAVHDTRLYAATHGDPNEPSSLHAIDIETGEVHWSVVSATEGTGEVTGACATGPTFWQRGEGVRGHDAATGREWVSGPSVVVGQSVIRIGTAVACQVQRDFASLMPDTGALLARRSGVAKGRLWSPGCHANGLFWFADWDELVALVPQNGQEYCRLRLPQRGIAPVLAGRRLIVPLKRSVLCVELDSIAAVAGADMPTS
jgi:hypothetical protein